MTCLYLPKIEDSQWEPKGFLPKKSLIMRDEDKILAYINKTEANLLLTLIDRHPSSQKSANSVIQ